MQDNNNHIDARYSKTDGQTQIRCPECGEPNVVTAVEDDTFTYGHGADAVDLTARIPIRTCQACGCQFTDDTAEDIRHEAVCRHLQVMPPKEISDLRKAHGLTRSEFARLTRIGEASLARWENGHIIQNAANDQLLFLLQYPENLSRLRTRFVNDCVQEEKLPDLHRASGKTQQSPAFKALEVTKRLALEAKAFTLRRVA